MTKRYLPSLFSVVLLLQIAVAMAQTGTGLEIDAPQQLFVVYTIEPVEIDKTRLETIVNNSLSKANIKQGQRDDARVFLRVEQHAGEYLLYLDFSRKVYYSAANQCFSKDGFVWGRYVKDITDITELEDDVQFLIDEFVEAYADANDLSY